MSKTSAKKKRIKQAREGQRNPELNRLGWHGVNPVERRTPTRSERMNRYNSKHKGKWNPNLLAGDDSILLEAV